LDKEFRDRMCSNILFTQLSPHAVVLKCPVKMLQGKLERGRAIYAKLKTLAILDLAIHIL